MSADYLAFDLGGSGGRLVRGRFDGRRLNLETVHSFGNEPVAVGDCLYWDLFGIYRELKAGIGKAAAASAAADASEVPRSIGFDSFSNDFAFIDRCGELLTPLRCYRDERTERHKTAIYARMQPERLYEITGNQIAPFNTLMQLAAMREAGQGHILDNAYKMLFTPDLLVHFLTGEAVTEYTMASVSQLHDIHTGLWSPEILAAFSLPRGMFCDIVPPGTIVGKTRRSCDAELGLSGLSVTAACEHDTASAFLAATSEGNRAIISSGTWSLVGTEVDSPIISESGYRHNIANEGGFGGRNRLLRNVMGLWIIQELRRQDRGQGKQWSFAELEEAAASAAPFAHSIDPDDPAYYAPEDMATTIARHCLERTGKAPSTMGETLRCILESLAFKYRWAVEKLEEMTGRPITLIHIVGGGSNNRLLCQFTANASGLPVLAGPTDASALGNILVQLLADRQISSIEEGKRLIADSFRIEEHAPSGIDEWNERYGQFKLAFDLD
ncbi:MAG: rhamnulokinase family protein [Spirochaetota bacterium]